MSIKKKQALITGASGLLGSRLAERFSGECELTLHFHSMPKNKPDIPMIIGDLGEIDHVKNIPSHHMPDIIINSAALADVDKCEFEPEESNKINVKAVKLLLKYFPKAKFVHISTDYVFNGDSPAFPDDERNPINTYGQHKCEGEELVERASSNNLIIRVNTLFDYGERKNFFKYVYDSTLKRQKVKAVTDQSSNPISAISAADIIYRLVEAHATGKYHAGGADFVTRYEFARAIAEFFNLDTDFVLPVNSDSFERRAKRPANAGLNCAKTEKFLGISMPTLQEEFEKLKGII